MDRIADQSLADWLDDYNREGEQMDMTQYAGSESKYLKAADLNGKRTRVKIDKVALLEFEDDNGRKTHKPALSFVGKEKQCVLNATNTQALCGAFGGESESWIGQEVELTAKHYATLGKDGIVVTPIGGKEPELDDDIPF